MKIPRDEIAEKASREENNEILQIALAEMRRAHARSKSDFDEGRSEDGYTESMCVLEWVRTAVELRKAGY